VIENNPTNVVAAFEMLLEEIQAEIDFINKGGARAFEEGDYEKAREALERAARATALRDQVDALRRAWSNLFAHDDEEAGTDVQRERRILGRLRSGLQTREEAYYRPILEALQTLGGTAPMNQVLDVVLQSMRGILKDVDYEPIPSNPEMPRWKKTAQWARNSMVKAGLLRNDSPRGIWQLSEEGIRYLQGLGRG
jgi:hypothetical protein